MQLGTRPLTHDELREVAPSIFAEDKAPSRSLRYTYIPTIKVLDRLELEGFLPFGAQESKTKDDDRRGFTRHLVRLRNPVAFSKLNVGDNFPEVVLTNAHDGTSQYKLMAGIFRLVCSNGMVVADSLAGSVHVRHFGNVVEGVLDATIKVAQRLKPVIDKMKSWMDLKLPPAAQVGFAEDARALRFAPEHPITARQLLEARRPQDIGNDLWHVYNRVQENLSTGGMTAVLRGAGNQVMRQVPVRGVTAIAANVKLNQRLWEAAERTADRVAVGV